jgi:adenine-specific DNA-methyltransferase
LRFFVGDRPDALVVDFFGGSGTTTHAVARLNQEDGGRRRSITITNNEVSGEEARDLRSRGIYPGTPEWEALGICQHIAVPRVTAAITGRTYKGEAVKGDYTFGEEFPMSEGLNENVEFFDLTYEDPALVSLGRRFEAIAPLLWLKSGAQGARIDQIDSQGWSLPDEATYGVLFNTSTWPRFVDAVAARDGSVIRLTHLFVVTDSLVEFQQVVSRLDQSLEITRLYADYLRSFEINTPR